MLSFFLCWFFLIGSFMFGRTARDTFFLSRFPTEYLPHMFIIIAVAIALTISVHSKLSKHYSLIPLMLATFAVGTGSYLIIFFIIKLFAPEWIYPVLYVWFEVVGTVMVIQFWLLTNSAFDTREAKRLFGVIASGGAVANTALGFSMGTLVDVLSADFLLPATALFIGLGFVMVLFIRQFLDEIPVSSSKRTFSSNKKKGGVLSSPYLKVMTLTIVAAAIAGTLVDYQMKIIVSDNLNESEMASLFGTLYGAIGLISILIQFFFTSRFLSRFGVLLALMFLPGTLLLGSSALLVAPVLATAICAKAGDQIFKFTLHDISSQLLWLPVSPQVKSKAKPFIDGTIKNLAGGLTGILIIGLMSLFNDVRVLSIPAIILLIIWIIANIKLKKGYVSELRTAVEKRRLDFEELNFDYTDPTIVEILRKTLLEGNEHQQLFTLETISTLPLTAWKSDLQKLLENSSKEIQSKVLELTKNAADIIPDETVLGISKITDGELTADALLVCGHRKLQQAVPLMKTLVTDSQTSIKAAATAGLLLMGDDDAEEVRIALDSLLENREAKIRLSSLLTVGHLPNILTEIPLKKLLTDDNSEVRRRAIDIAGDRPNSSFIPNLVSSLHDSFTAPAARRSLRLHNSEEVSKALTELITNNGDVDDSTSLNTVLRCLGDLDSPETVDTLITVWPKTSSNGREEIADSLSRIAKRGAMNEVSLEETVSLLEETLMQAYELEHALSLFQDDNDSKLVADMLSNELSRMKVIILQLALLNHPDAPLQTFAHAVTTPGASTLANVLEYLDNVLEKTVREKVVPLLDETNASEKVQVGIKLFELQSKSAEEWLTDWLNGKSNYTSAVAFDYVLKKRLELGEGVLSSEWLNNRDSLLHNETLAKIGKDWKPAGFENREIMEETPMYTTLEKTLFLKGVTLFKDIPGEEVAHIAQIADTINLESNEVVFEDGDPGDSMFIIVDGEVLIHKEGKEIATLGDSEFIGEMAILDQEPRSASATTQEETVLLRISGEDFFDLMGSRMDIVQGIMRVLTRRLREAIA